MTRKTKTNSFLLVSLMILLSVLLSFPLFAQKSVSRFIPEKQEKIIYGQASFYANKFHGRQTANGETFNQDKLTAACNVLPLGTWIKVTNLKNGKSIIVRTNDRLHPKT